MPKGVRVLRLPDGEQLESSGSTLEEEAILVPDAEFPVTVSTLLSSRATGPVRQTSLTSSQPAWPRQGSAPGWQLTPSQVSGPLQNCPSSHSASMVHCGSGG